MNTTRNTDKHDRNTVTIRLNDLLPKHNNVNGGKAEMIFGITRNSVEKGRLPLIKQ